MFPIHRPLFYNMKIIVKIYIYIYIYIYIFSFIIRLFFITNLIFKKKKNIKKKLKYFSGR